MISGDSGQRLAGVFAWSLVIALFQPAASVNGQGGEGPGAWEPDRVPAGFTSASWPAQRLRERAFLAVPSSGSAAETARWLTRAPHLAGTEGAAILADSLAARLRELGFTVEIERFDVWIPHPRSVTIRLRAGPEADPVTLDTRQPARSDLAGADSTLLLGWNAYSASGAVEAPVVYANYGLADDYAVLEARGVDIEGAIVLARYGRAYRGVKVAEAEARGAVGVVLYSDPADNGHVVGDTVPGGPMMPGAAIQLGTVSYLWRHTGDPLTPGRPALLGVPRIATSASSVLPTIPVAPIGYAATEGILHELEGPAPPEFAGGLEAPYRVGPGPARLAIDVDLGYEIRPVRDVIARLPAPEPEGVAAPMIVLGNHYDAWLWGGVDPHTGTTALLEIARGLAAVAADGWRPRREIVLAFWDAEEMNVAGSTEWVEAHADELAARAVAYFNVDVLTAGVLDVAGSPQLRDLAVEAAETVVDPTTGRPLAEAWRTRQTEDPPPGTSDLPGLGLLGAGSDWTAFRHWAGVPSLQWTMNGRGSWAAYHSAYDDFMYARDFADSAFVMTPAFARAMGLAALRLAEADALPYDYTAYADRIEAHLEELTAEFDDKGLSLGVEAARLDSLRSALAGFRAAAEGIERERAAALAAGDRLRLDAIDERLRSAEWAFLDPRGLPGRPWYRHTLVAPDARNGYGPLPLPAIVEALRASDGAALERAISQVVAALQRASFMLEPSR